MNHGGGSAEEEAKELCHRMLVQGVLNPFSDGSPELHGDSNASGVFNVRPFISLFAITQFYINDTSSPAFA